MPDPVLKQLQQRAALALQHSDCMESRQYFYHAFTLFSEETRRLKEVYANLQQQFLGVNRELTVTRQDLKKKIEETSHLTDLLSHLLKEVSEGVLFIDLKGTILTLNESGSNLLRVSREETVFHPFWNRFPDSFFGFSMKKALCLGVFPKLFYQKITLEKGRPVELEISTAYFSKGPSRWHGVSVSFRDVTKLQRFHSSCQRTERLRELGELVTSIAHEIRNPLGGIRGYALLLHRDLSHLPCLQEMVQRVLEGTKNLEKYVSDILQYARPVQISLQSEELGSFLKQVGQFVRVDPVFPSTVELEIHIPQHPVLIPIDHQTLRSALLNLIYNGIHAMPSGGKLTIALLKREQACQIDVSDTGIGMDEEHVSRVFSPSFTTKQRGNGIGLSETQKIIQAHGGTIQVRSQPQRGTTFTMILPMRRSFE